MSPWIILGDVHLSGTGDSQRDSRESSQLKPLFLFSSGRFASNFRFARITPLGDVHCTLIVFLSSLLGCTSKILVSLLNLCKDLSRKSIQSLMVSNLEYVVAEIITELICFEPKVCICNGNLWENMREPVSAMRDFLRRFLFPQICLCNGQQLFWQHDSVSVIEIDFPQKKCLSVCNLFGCYGSCREFPANKSPQGTHHVMCLFLPWAL